MGLKPHFLSLKAKEAIKVGLAFALVYIIALQYDWMNPYWAGLSVAMVAAAPNGQTIHKGFGRLLGTIPGVIAALVIFSIAVQDRWLFVFLSAAWVSFTSYMMIRSSKNTYFWNVVGFVSLIILTTSPDSSANIFQHAISRVAETALGVIVYTLVTVFLWPKTNINTLSQISTNLISSQAKLFQFSIAQINSEEGREDQQKLRKSEFTLLASLQQSYDAKEADSYAVHERISVWKEFHTLSMELMQTLNRLHNGFAALPRVDANQLFPGIDVYNEEISRRFELAIDQFDGKKEYEVKPIAIDLDESYLESLRPFQQIAIAASKQELQAIEKLSILILQSTRTLNDDSIYIKEKTPSRQTKSIINKSTYAWLPDLESLKASLIVGLSVIVGYMVWFYIDPPKHSLWTMMSGLVAMMLANTPQLKITKFFVPLFISIVLVLLLYVFVMPALSTYVGLAIMLFSAVFVVMYFFPPPMRVLSFASICMVINISNHQTYDFAAQLSFGIFLLIVIIIPYVLSYLLNSTRPEKKISNLLVRYFKAIEFLLFESPIHDKKGFIVKLKFSFYSHELKVLPGYLAAWAKFINYKHFNNNSQEEVQHLIAGISSLSISVQELILALHLKQTKLTSQETKDELYNLSKGLEAICKNYSNDLSSKLSAGMEKALKKYIENSEASINKHLVNLRLSTISKEEKDNFFRLFGGFQGLSLALVSYAGVAEEIDWEHWREEVFS